MTVLRNLRPSERVKTVLDVDYDRLWSSGKRAILFDLDNTLGRRLAPRPDEAVFDLLRDLVAQGFRVAVLSNRRHGLNGEMVRSVADLYPLVSRAGKPRIRHLLLLLERLGVTPDETVMIGDRILTDVLAGNLAGLHTIRVSRAV